MSKLAFGDRAQQRARIYLGRAVRTASGGLKSPCIYMHVPKCGGTSVSEALYATVPLHRKIGILDAPSIRRALAMYHLGKDDVSSFHDEGERASQAAAFREHLVLMHIAHGCQLIHGHFLLSDRLWDVSKERYKYISILRDPVARTISNYRMAHRNSIFRGDLDAFLDSAMGRRMAQHAIRFFSGRPTIEPGEEAEALDLARRRMAGFSLIGFLEDLNGFSHAFADIFGVRPRVAHHNRATGPELHVTPSQRTRLEELCAPDIELTDSARRAT